MFRTELQIGKHLHAGVRWRKLLIALWGVIALHAQAPNDSSFLSTLGELREATYSDKESITERLSRTGHPSVPAVLTAFMEDRLYFRNDDQKIFVVKSADADPLTLIDPLTLKEVGSASADSMTKIGTNNGLRRTIRIEIAHFSLASPDVAVRLDAVREMLRSLDEPTVALLRQRLALEPNAGVKKEIATGIALADLEGSDPKSRLDAIGVLKHSSDQDVRNKLASLSDKSPDGTFVKKM